MAGDLRVQATTNAAYAPPPGSPRAPQAATAPQAPLNRDGLSRLAATGSVPATQALAAPQGPNLSQFFRGFHAGSSMEISAEGFFGSSSVGGEARMNTLHADAFNLSIHVTAPFTDRRETMSFTREGANFRSGDGHLHAAALSNGGRTLTLTNLANPSQKVLLTVARPGVLVFGSLGMGYDGKNLTATAQ